MTWPAAPSLPGLSYLHPSTSRFVKRCSAAADREQTTVQQQHQTATPSNTNTHAGTAAACQLVHLIRCRVRLLSLPAAVAGRGRRTPPLRAASYKYTHMQTPLPLIQGTWATPASTRPTIDNHESRIANTNASHARASPLASRRSDI